MLLEFFSFLKQVVLSSFDMLGTSSSWMLLSFMIAGLLHEFLSPEKMKRSSIGTKKVSGVFWSTISGALIPICSCGTIPLGISLYYSGAYLGPTLAFMTSSPMINPIAVLLSWGLLGPQITVIYIITGLVAPMIIGIVANKFGGKEVCLYPEGENQEDSSPILLEEEKMSVRQKIKSGLHWSFTELAVTVSKYAVSGMLIAGLLFNIVPQSAIQTYLGNPGFISLFGITVIAALMYVCAVGHLPFIVAIVASGAAPGVAITFLMAGAATNIPELITISKTMGKRSALMYFGMVTVISNLVGFITNCLLMPGFKPVMDFDTTHKTIEAANRFIVTTPDWLQNLCSFVMIGYACLAFYKWLKSHSKKAQA